ncbi:MAG: trypsin-like peptidase domain-containing protein [Lachnospiraceae bacterium]|nr:trypsin-like peptidase domain-containing protein [Lachnospiraceae bacterium]
MNDEFYEEANNERSEIVPEKSEKVPEKKKKSGAAKVFKKGVAIVISAALFGTVAGGALYSSNYILKKEFNKESTESVSKDETSADDKGKNPVDIKLTKSDEESSAESTTTKSNTGAYSIPEIVEKCMPSVVAITNLGINDVRTIWGTYQQESKSAGSGVIVAKTDDELLILTNNHVVNNSKELTVIFSFDENSEEPTPVNAYVKGQDEDRDLAVIGISMKNLNEDILSKISIAVVGNSDKLDLGEQVVAIGNALGYGQSVTTGIVSALNRTVTLSSDNGGTISNEYIQTDAAINPGNSGGALLNMKGELVGINSAKVSSSSVEGVCYAIPITDVYDEVEQMMNEEAPVILTDKEKGYLCISGDDLDELTASRYHLPQGVYISTVIDGYAAANAGIEAGDLVIKVEDKEIKNMSELKNAIAGFKGGDEVSLTVLRYDDDSRSYQEKDVTVKLDDYDKFTEFSKELEEQQKNSKDNRGNNKGNNGGNNGLDDDEVWKYFFGN